MRTSLQMMIIALIGAFLLTGGSAAGQNKLATKPAKGEYAIRGGQTAAGKDLGFLSDPDAAKAACDTLNLALYKNVWTIVNYSVLATPPLSDGYVNGVNTYGDKAKANYFPNSGANTLVLGGLVAFANAYSTNPAKIITVKILNSVAGSPGTNVLAQQTFTMQEIMSDVSGNYFTNVVFSTPAPVNGQPFFMVVDFSTLNWSASHDTLSIQSNEDGETTPGAAWEYQTDNTWYPMSSSTNSWGINFSLAMFPVMANVAANATFTQSATNTCSDYQVNLDGSASAAAVYSWDLPGANPSSSNVAAPVVTYAAAGTYPIKLYILGGSCNNLDSMISSITVVQSPSPNATATPPSICNGQSSVLNASNGILYQWSGFPPGPPSSVTVYPATNTNYTVTVTASNSCSATQKVTVTVHQLPDPAASANPTVICLGGSSLVSSTPGMTSYAWTPGGATTAAFLAMPTQTTIYTVTVVDGFTCTNTDTVRVVVDSCTGMSDNNAEGEFIISPNPADGLINLRFASADPGDVSIDIYDPAGRLLGTETVTPVATRISKQFDLSYLRRGIYFMKLTSGKNTFIRKILIY